MKIHHFEKWSYFENFCNHLYFPFFGSRVILLGKRNEWFLELWNIPLTYKLKQPLTEFEMISFAHSLNNSRYYLSSVLQSNRESYKNYFYSHLIASKIKSPRDVYSSVVFSFQLPVLFTKLSQRLNKKNSMYLLFICCRHKHF